MSIEPGARRRFLGQVAYPADTDRIVTDLVNAEAPPELVHEVARLEDRMYMSTDDLEQALDQASD